MGDMSARCEWALWALWALQLRGVGAWCAQLRASVPSTHNDEQHSKYMAIAQPLYARFVEEVFSTCCMRCM